MANFLDRTIAAVAPVWGAKRASARLAIEHLRGFDAAKLSRRTENWKASTGSANAELDGQAARIRARARDLVRNNAWARSATRKLAGKVIGTGITPHLQAQTIGERPKEAVKDFWAQFVDTCDVERRHDFYGLQHLAARTMIDSGEVLLKIIRRESSSRLRVPFQLQVLEPDYLDSSRTEVLADGGAIIQGVQYNSRGERAGYWLFREHPGENYQSWRGGPSLESTFHPARDILHVFPADRPGQARGVSAFASVALRMRDVDDFDDSTLYGRKIASCFVGFVTQAAGPMRNTIETKKDAQGQVVESIKPGTLMHGQPGDTIQFGTPPTDENFADYMRYQLHAIAAGVGCTYEQLTGDLSQLNFSSIKAGLNDFWDYCEYLQYLVLVPQLCAPVWSVFGEYATAAGIWPATKPMTARWVTPRKRWVDPGKEIDALTQAVRSGFTTLYDVIAEQGEDPEERLAEMIRINAALDAGKIVLESDPRQDRKAKPAPAPADPAQAPTQD